MPERPLIVVCGGGPAGVSAAVTLAGAGADVLLVEQRDRLGGAVHRQPANEDVPPVWRPKRHRRAWQRLAGELADLGERVTVASSTVFAGIDGHGFMLLDDRAKGEVLAVKPQGAVLALGGIERVVPFPGWELPGVMTAGGMQVLLKESGRPPSGRTLIAGSGPLLLALAAQLCASGRPPVAVLEKGRPFARIAAGSRLLLSPPHVLEALSYARRIAAARVPYLTGAQVVRAVEEEGGLRVTVARGAGETAYAVDTLVVHDGVATDRDRTDGFEAPYPIMGAGDQREVLGADAAVLDGRRAAVALARSLGLRADGDAAPRGLDSARRVQADLAALFASPRRPLPAETMLCRCEGRRVADLPPGVSAREAKLVARFGMGRCQGRFCAANAADIAGAVPSPGDFRPRIARWPTRPLSVGALARLRYLPSGDKGEPDE
ncbi:MAG: FAD-dependent oxidoreductase [Aquamicrobium sp.]|uniref:FAD-dependent oxidoreductase n=1 Tax=Aquamicrobium sp. TaxID=1872579 RepID=UPI00349E9C2D|nr:FAD-dependent oxidoreductase [Aquamicrobium sp.]MCO5158565.1 FAD-dependent oxidoreductase [Aquamicrobium sp.]